MEEMVFIIKQNVDNLIQVSQLVVIVCDSVEKGGNVVFNVVDVMGKIEDFLCCIFDIIGVIDEIVFQINFLVLNVVVEVVCVGDVGWGFVVVVLEVCFLVQWFVQVVKDIKDFIVDLIEQVQGGVELVNEIGEVFNEIVDSIKKVVDIVVEIFVVFCEQVIGVDEINIVVIQMDEMMQQNFVFVEENVVVVKIMNDQVSCMCQCMSFFNVGQDIGGFEVQFVFVV